jgi:hypothetical protein
VTTLEVELTHLSRGAAWFNRTAANPPIWMRAAYIPLFAVMAFALTKRRGWELGVVAAIVYGGLAISMALSPGGVVAWSRAHPKLDGAMLGPVTFLAMAYLTRLSVWWCLVAGLTGVAIGAELGVQRDRRRRRAD